MFGILAGSLSLGAALMQILAVFLAERFGLSSSFLVLFVAALLS